MGRIEVSGFSLIELMVVMAIMAVLMGLSGGLMQNSINKQAKHVELEKVVQLFKKISYQAYYGSGKIKIRLQQNQMQVFHSNHSDFNDYTLNNGSHVRVVGQQYSHVETISFEQLIFVAQDYIISSKGVVSPNHYQVFDRTNIKKVKLLSLFSENVI